MVNHLGSSVEIGKSGGQEILIPIKEFPFSFVIIFTSIRVVFARNHAVFARALSSSFFLLYNSPDHARVLPVPQRNGALPPFHGPADLKTR